MTNSDRTEKTFSRKELVLLETLITEFYEKNCIPEIQKLAFLFPYVSILGTHCCGKELRNVFKSRGNLHDFYAVVIM